jgi:hypothetical protein
MKTNTEHNANYNAIISTGYQLDVTTSNKNKGTLYLMKNGAVLHSVPFSTHGKGTKAILEKLPNCYRHGTISAALQQLRAWIDSNQVNPLPAVTNDSFTACYNDAIKKFGQQALAKVNEAKEANPELTFEKLFRIYSVEMLYLAKTDNKEWVMS